VNTRGLVIWPADAGAAAVARWLAERLGELGVEADDIREITPVEPAELRAQLTESVRHLVELRRRQRIRLLVLATAADPDAPRILPLLDPASRLLQQLVAQRPDVLMAVLLPSAFAEADERQRAADLLSEFETRVWEARPVRVCFLNATGTDTLARARADGTRDADLLELLRRELADEALAPLSEPIGFARANMHDQYRGRTCCYSALGAVTLLYPREACLRFLHARMSQQVFESGLRDPSALSAGDLDALRGRANAFIERQVRDLGPRLPAIGTIQLPGFEHAAADDGSGWGAKAASEVSRAVGGPLPRDLIEAITGISRREIERVLASGPGYLAGGLAFVEALEGQLLFDPIEQRNTLTGVAHFREQLCTIPLVDAVVTILDPLLDGLLAEVGVAAPPQQEDEGKLQWIRRAVEGAEAAAAGSEKGARVRCVRAMLAHVLDDVLAGAGADRELLALRVIAVFASEAGRLRRAIDERRTALEALAREEASLPGRYGWWSRSVGKKAASYREERLRMQNAAKKLQAESAALTSLLEGLGSLLEALLNRAAVPYDWKSKLANRFAADVEAAAREYRDFLGEVAAALPPIQPVPEVHTATIDTLHTPDRLDRLYGDVRRSCTWNEHAARTLAFLPTRAVEIPYAGCRDLAEHYRQGPLLLARRIGDYAADRIGAVSSRHAVDILEMDGPTEAGRFLEMKATEAGRFLAFDETAIASFEQQHGQCDVLYVVQTGGGKESPFAERYRAFFRPQVEFLDSDDPDTIDITCLRFGFPATILRGLEHTGSGGLTPRVRGGV